MSIKNRIRDLANQRHQSIAEVERHLAFGNGTIAKWDDVVRLRQKVTKGGRHLMSPPIIFLVAPILHSSLAKMNDVQKFYRYATEGLSNDSSLAYMKNGGEELDKEDAELLRATGKRHSAIQINC